MGRHGRMIVALFILLPAVVTVGHASPSQEVVGRVRLPTPSGAELARRAFLATDGQVNGVTGFVFQIDVGTIDGRFELTERSDGTGDADVAIVFYENIAIGAVCGIFARPGDEGGSPCGSHAIVYLEAGTDVPFRYTARLRERDPGPSPSPTASPSPTVSPSPSASPSPSPSPTIIPSPSLSPMPKPEPVGGPAVTFQMTPVHDGLAPETNLAPPLEQRWMVDLGGDLTYPVVSDGRVHVSFPAEGGSQLVTLDLASGETLWGPEPISGTYAWSGLTLDRGRVYVINSDGLLSAFDAADGSLDWSVDLPLQHSFSAPPTAFDGVVYVGGAGSGGTLYAVDGSNGELLWTATVRNGDRSSPTVIDDAVFVSYACQQTYRFDRATGAEVWHHSTGCSGGGGATAVFHEDLLYDLNTGYPEGDQVVLDAETGEEVRDFVASQPPAFHGNLGFFLSDGTLRGKRLSTEETLWSFAGDGGIVAPPIVANGSVYAASDDGDLWVLSEETGEVVWTGDLGSPVRAWNALVAAEGYLLVTASSTLIVHQ